MVGASSVILDIESHSFGGPPDPGGLMIVSREGDFATIEKRILATLIEMPARSRFAYIYGGAKGSFPIDDDGGRRFGSLWRDKYDPATLDDLKRDYVQSHDEWVRLYQTSWPDPDPAEVSLEDGGRHHRRQRGRSNWRDQHADSREAKADMRQRALAKLKARQAAA